MHWKELEKEIAKTEWGGGAFWNGTLYGQALGKLRWDGGEESLARNLDIVCAFMDRSEPKVRPVDKKRLREVWRQRIEPVAETINEVALERHGMLRALENNGPAESIGQLISSIYDELANLPFIGLTNASRLLHFRFPRLFVTTDEATRCYWWERVRLHRLFGLKRDDLFTGYGYTFILLPFVKSHAVDAIMLYVRDYGITIPEAVNELQNLGGERQSIARLMDRYFYAVSRQAN